MERSYSGSGTVQLVGRRDGKLRTIGRKWRESLGVGEVLGGGMATVQFADSHTRETADGSWVTGAVVASMASNGMGTVQRTNSEQAKDKR